MTVKAYAKINWTLDIKARRADGYHEIDSIMQSISLSDELKILPDQSLRVVCEDSSISSGDNTVARAMQTMYTRTKHVKGVLIRLIKNIPVAAGLGGGSADAAAALVGLCKHWNAGFSREELMKIGVEIGADVPFCLLGGAARARGIGEILNPLRVSEPIWVILVKPCEGLSTAEVYGKVQVEKISRRPFNDYAAAALQTGNIQQLAEAMGNVLEPFAIGLRPEIGEAIEDVKESGALRAQMSGSGPTVFGVYPTQHVAEAALFLLRSRYKNCHLACTVPEGVGI